MVRKLACVNQRSLGCSTSTDGTSQSAFLEMNGSPPIREHAVRAGITAPTAITLSRRPASRTSWRTGARSNACRTWLRMSAPGRPGEFGCSIPLMTTQPSLGRSRPAAPPLAAQRWPGARQVRPGAGAHGDAGRLILRIEPLPAPVRPSGARASIQYLCRQGTTLYSASL
jgi:hypothetical protein